MRRRRVLQFPKQQSVGELYSGCAHIGSARGEVSVEQDALLELRLGENTPLLDLSFTERLKEDDLQSIRVEIQQFDDENLARLVKLKGLRALDVRCTRVTDTCFQYLSDFKSLETLDLAYTRVTGVGATALGYIPLRVLDASHTLLNDDGLAEISSLSSIRQLILMDNGISRSGIQSLAGMNYLEVLFLSRTNIEDSYMSLLSEMPSLVVADLSRTPLTDAGIHALSSSSTVRYLVLENTRITDEGLRHLASMPSLEGLYLGGTDITDEGLRALRRLPNLTHLSLASTQIADDGLLALSELPSLVYIDVQKTNVSPLALYQFAVENEHVDVRFSAGPDEPPGQVSARQRAGAERHDGIRDSESMTSGLRTQIFELIVKEAMLSDEWKETFASAMSLNGISEDEVKAEVKRRLR